MLCASACCAVLGKFENMRLEVANTGQAILLPYLDHRLSKVAIGVLVFSATAGVISRRFWLPGVLLQFITLNALNMNERCKIIEE